MAITSLDRTSSFGIEYDYIIDTLSGDFSSLPNNCTFIDLETREVYRKNPSGQIISVFEGGGFFTLNISELQTLIGSDSLVPGALYRITNANSGLYGGTEIILKAVNSNTLDSKGMGKFYNPIYTGTDNGVWSKYGWFAASSLSGNFNRGESITANNGATGTLVGIVNPSINSQFTFFIPIGGNWTTATSITGNTTGFTASITSISVPSYSIGTKVNWGGRVWENLTGSVGSSVTTYGLDSTNWDIVSYNEVDYIVEWDEITYDVENDFITFRRDSRGNKVEQSYSNFVNSTGDYSIKVFQWGNNKVIDNTCENSLFEIINHMGGNIYGNKISGDCFIISNVFGRGFTMLECEFKTYTQVFNNFFFRTSSQSGLYYLSLGELSEINNSQFINFFEFSYSNMSAGGISNFSSSQTYIFYCSINFGYLRNFRGHTTILNGFTNISECNFNGGGLRFSASTTLGTDTYKDKNIRILDMSIGGNNTLTITTTSTIIFDTLPSKRIYRRPDTTFGITYINNVDTPIYANANA
jgi:hypothetical protein